jgi:purine-nucleoside phosphorylase
MSEHREAIDRAIAAIREYSALEPEAAIILGTGLGGLAKEITLDAVIPYGNIPGFPLSTVETHAGKLLLGTLNGKKVVAMQGRFHIYEGYSPHQIAVPVQVMKYLGARFLIISNVAGGLNPAFNKGDIMILCDHINLLGGNPLIGRNDDSIGLRFPDMSEPYNRELMALAERIAGREGIAVQKGVYAAMTGPSLETAAEYRMLRIIGADAVGMSTVPEVIAGVHIGMKILGLSVITDLCSPETLEPVDILEIIRIAGKTEPLLTLLIKQVILNLPQ